MIDKGKIKEILRKYWWNLGQSEYNDEVDRFVREVLALLPQVDEKGLLTDGGRSEIIQRDCQLWCPTKGEFLDEVGKVIAKAQHLADEIRHEEECQFCCQDSEESHQKVMVNSGLAVIADSIKTVNECIEEVDIELKELAAIMNRITILLKEGTGESKMV